MTKSKFLIKTGIMAASSVQLSIMGIAVAIGPMLEHFTGATQTKVMSVVTIPSLVSIPIQLIYGANAAKFGKRMPLLLGIAIVSICGLTPAFIDIDLNMLLLACVGIGIGVGLIVPTSTGLITDYFKGDEARGLLGKQSAFINLGAMLLSSIGGFLCISGWRNTFFIYGYTLLMGLIILVCIPKDKKLTISDNDAIGKAKLSREVFVLSAAYIAFGMCIGIGNTNNSIHVGERAIGDSAVAGIAGSVMTGCGIAVGVMYGKIAALLKKWALPTAFVSGFAGLLLAGSASDIFVFCLGSGLTGVGLSLAMPTGLFRIASSVEQSASTFAMSIMLSAYNVGMFLAPIVLNPISNAVLDGTAQSRFFIGAAILAVLTVYGIIHVSKDKA